MKRSVTLAAGLLITALLLPTGTAQSMSPSAAEHPDWPGHGQLFVGTCYQPIDRSPEEIHRDIALMKQAGFSLVRMGDLSWDSFEPAENQFDFAWFDRMLDEMHTANIKVILDIGGLPAPIWLHHKYPSVNVVNQDGVMLHPAERYMVNIADPIYRAQVIHFADELTKHYAHNPALAAIGYDNEIGSGFMSYSAGDRERFIAWLKVKYPTIGDLNKAWATQRWSRHLNSFDEVELPYGEGPGPGERYLDLHRFWSDVTISVLEDLEKIRERNTPNLPAVSNLWDTNPRRGFDYLSSYKKYVSYGAEGFYPVDPLHASVDVLLTKGDLPTPTWYNEFVTGGPGNYGTKGTIRMWAYIGLIDYGQTYLAWTFNTHRGGEEQALFGLLDHDGTPSWKYREFAQIASEFAKLEQLGFPRYHKPDVAIAYSFDSLIASHPAGSTANVRRYFTTGYREQVDSSLQPFFEDNIDAALINIAHAKLDYKLLVVPADFVMDAASADAIRSYVGNGGTVVMTAFSAKVDEHGQWFNTALPGRLSDVFGIRTEEFYRPTTAPEFSLDGVTVKTNINFYEVLEPRGAQLLASFTNTPEKSPAITINTYGKGRAIYVSVPAQMPALAPLMRSLSSGDRICYHGVSDIFREPKPAAGFYKSQCDPEEEIVLEPAYHWARNDENTGFTTAVVCSNCDHLKFFLDSGDGFRPLAEADPDRKQFSHLRYAPFSVPFEKAAIRNWGNLRIDGYIKDKKVISKSYSGRGVDCKFVAVADDRELRGDGADTTRVVLRVTDEFDRIRPIANDPIVFELSGPGQIIGDNPFALTGGTGAIWIRATEQPGTIVLRAKHPRLGTQQVEIRVAATAPENV